MMKTKTLLMVAGAGVLVYWLWKKNNKRSEVAKENASTKSECEKAGGRWISTTPEPTCPTCAVPAVMINKCVQNMKTKTLLMVAGAGALVYWLYRQQKTKARNAANSESECKEAGGTWYPRVGGDSGICGPYKKPEPNTIRNAEECIAQGYFWGGSGFVAACFENEEAARMQH